MPQFEKNHDTLLQELGDASVDLVARTSSGATSMHTAAETDNTDAAEYLLEKGVSIDDTDNWGDTSLFRAVQNGKRSMVHCLIDNGASVDAEDVTGRTVLDWAQGSGLLGIFPTLEEHIATSASM